MKKTSDEPGNPKPMPFDDVLKRMLASPPAPHIKKKPSVFPHKKPAK
jgi:hypothetical protein